MLRIKKLDRKEGSFIGIYQIFVYIGRERERKELKIRNSRVYFSGNRYMVSSGVVCVCVCVYEIMESWRNIKVRREGETTKGKRGGRA